tara:strand:+ start:5763 stop:7646 length:1884 start_codon:yes stop_codon:yes gene_type:complete
MAIVKELELKVTTKGAQKNVEDLNTDLKETQADLSGVENVADKATGGMISGFKGATSAIGGVIKGFKSMRMAIIATGIGALVLAIASIGAAFTQSEEGQNKFNKLMGVLGSITGNLLDILSNLGKSLISAFENPKQAVKDFANLIKDNIVNRFEGLMELIPALGKAVSLLFKGEFSEAGKVAANATAKVVLGVENVVEKTQDAIKATVDFTNELKEEAKIAAKIADDRAKANLIERKNIVERAKANRENADLRFKAEQRDKFAVEERIKFLEEASAIEEEITNKEIEAARLRFEAKKAENKLSKSTKEDKDEEAQLEARLIELETSKLRMQKRLQTSLTTFRNEEKAAAKQRKTEAQAVIDSNKKIADEAIVAENKRIATIEALQNAADIKEAERQDKQYNLLQELQNTAEEQELFKLSQQYDAKFELAMGNAELEKALEEQQQIDAAAIEDKYNNESLLNSQKITKAKNDLSDAEKQTKLDNLQAVSGALNGLSALAGENAEAQKGIGIAQATIDTFLGANKAIGQGGIAGAIAAVGIIAAGLANVKNIISTKIPKPPGSSGGIGGNSTLPPAPSQPPSFNVVGQSGFNQVAGALGSQPPIQAFVVAGAVTNAQQLQNNTINQATF